MRSITQLVIVVSLLIAACACANVSATPTGPSPIGFGPTIATPAVVALQFPSLAGRWRVIGNTAFHNITNGATLNWGGCAGGFSVDSQESARFSGQLNTSGGGANSDRFCTASRTLTGELVAPDGSVARAWLEGESRNWPPPSVSPSCEIVAAGDGVWTGTATSEAIQLHVKDTLRCAANVDGGLFNAPMTNFERTVSLTFQR